MKKQKFFRGHRVRIADNLGPAMTHFPAGLEAIVVHSYSDAYGGNNHHDYNLLVHEPDGWHVTAWYHEKQLTLLDADRDKGEAVLQENKREAALIDL